MLAINFSAPVDVTISFDDSDDEIKDIEKEINTKDCSNSAYNKTITSITRNYEDIQQNSKSKEANTQNIESLDKNEESIKNCSSILPGSSIARKRKLEELPSPVNKSIYTTAENNEKHTVITTTHGQTHIIVAPPKNTSQPTSATRETSHYIDNSLKTISEHLIMIIEAFQQFSSMTKDKKKPEKYVDASHHFSYLKNYFFSISYSTVVTIMVPQENDILFVTRFLKETVRLAKIKNTVKITNEQQIFPLYNEMLEWTKNKQKQLQEMNLINLNKEQNRMNVSDRLVRSDRPAQNKTTSKTNKSDNSNTHLITLLQPSEKTERITHNIKDYFKNNTMPYSNANILRTNSSNAQANLTGQIFPSPVVSKYSTVTNTVQSQSPNNCSHNDNFNLQTKPSDKTQYQQVQPRIPLPTRSSQNMYQPPQQGLSQMTLPYGQNAYQQTQHSLSHTKSIVHNPYQYMQQGIPQTTSLSHPKPSVQNVPQNTQHAQLNQRNINADFAFNQYSGTARGNVPVPLPTFQNNIYNHNRTDQQHIPLAPTRRPPPYEMPCYWKNCQAPKSISVEQQPTQAAQSRTPGAPWQHQAEPQQPEVTRSMSTDSGIMSPPLPFIDPSDATNSYHLAEEEQPTPFITHVTSLNPNVSFIDDGKCAVCFKITRSKCLCLEKYYCCYDCQKSDWNSHRMICSTQKNQDLITQ